MHRFLWIILFLFLSLVACSTKSGLLSPLEPYPTPGGEFSGEPRLVTFSELNSNPSDYRNQLIRITGSYYHLPIQTCEPRSGPLTMWALNADNVLLEVDGFGQLVRLISDDDIVELTVDGFFRLYEGPLGCGKGAPEKAVWFLELVQIVQPNALVKSGQEGVVGMPAARTPLISSATEESNPDATIVPTIQTTNPPGTISVPTSTGHATTPVSGTATPTQSGTPAQIGVPTTTSTPTSATTMQATGTLSATPTATRTPTPGPSLTPTPSRTPRSTSTQGATPTPSLTPTPSPTVSSYPGPSPEPTSYP